MNSRYKRLADRFLRLATLCVLVVGMLGIFPFLHPKEQTAEAAHVVQREQYFSNSTANRRFIEITWPQATQEGNLLVAALTLQNGDGVTVTPPSADWHVITVSNSPNTGTRDAVTHLFYNWNAASTSGIARWDFSASRSAILIIAEYSGIENTVDPLVAFGSAQGMDSPLSSGGVNENSRVGGLLFGSLAIADADGTIYNETEGYNIFGGTGVTQIKSEAFGRSITETGTYSVGASLISDPNTPWAGAIALFRAVPGSAPEPPIEVVPQPVIPHFLNAQPAATCITEPFVDITLSANLADSYLASNDEFFVDATWKPFASPTTITWEVPPGEGTKTIYFLFRSYTRNLSNLLTTQVFLDETNNCGLPIAEEPVVVEPPVEVPSEEPMPSPEPAICSIECANLSYEAILRYGGQQISSSSIFASVKQEYPGLIHVGYEVLDADFDYDDIVMEIDVRTCGSPTFEVERAEVAGELSLSVKDNGRRSEYIVFAAEDLVSNRAQTISFASEMCDEGDIINTDGAIMSPIQPGDRAAVPIVIGPLTVYSGKVSGEPTVTRFLSTLPSQFSHDYVGSTIRFLSGHLTGQDRTITQFDPITGAVTLDFPLPAPTELNDEFIVLAEEAMVSYPQLPALPPTYEFLTEDESASIESDLQNIRINLSTASRVYVTGAVATAEQLDRLEQRLDMSSADVQAAIDRLPLNDFAATTLRDLAVIHEHDRVDERTLLTKLSDLQAINDLLIALIEGRGRSPVAKQYFSYGTFNFNYLFLNPLQSEQLVDIRDTLPSEVDAEIILHNDGFAVDVGENVVVQGLFLLEPGEAQFRQISVQDVWVIEESELEDIISQSRDLNRVIATTNYAAYGDVLNQEIASKIVEIRDSQLESSVTAQMYLVRYKENQLRLEEARRMLGLMEELLPVCVAADARQASLVGFGVLAAILLVIVTLVSVLAYYLATQNRLLKKATKTLKRRIERQRQVVVAMLLFLIMFSITVLFWYQGWLPIF